MTLQELSEKVPEKSYRFIAKALLHISEDQKRYKGMDWIPSNGIPNEQVIKEMGAKDENTNSIRQEQ